MNWHLTGSLFISSSAADQKPISEKCSKGMSWNVLRFPLYQMKQMMTFGNTCETNFHASSQNADFASSRSKHYQLPGFRSVRSCPIIKQNPAPRCDPTLQPGQNIPGACEANSSLITSVVEFCPLTIMCEQCMNDTVDPSNDNKEILHLVWKLWQALQQVGITQ